MVGVLVELELADMFSHFFPPVMDDEAEAGEGKVKIAGGEEAKTTDVEKTERKLPESAETEPTNEGTTHDDKSLADLLPNAPTTEPNDAAEPPTKKAKVKEGSVEDGAADSTLKNEKENAKDELRNEE